jgi:hypothetical protein
MTNQVSQVSQVSQISRNRQNGSESKLVEKLNELSTKLSININKLGESLTGKINTLESVVSNNIANQTSLTTINENFTDEVKQGFNSQKALLIDLKTLTNNNSLSYNQLLGVIEKLSSSTTENNSTNETLNKQLTSAITILNSKLDNQSISISKLEDCLNKEDLANIVLLFGEKLNDIVDNQSTDVVNVLEKINSLEAQLAKNIELNTKVVQKIEPLENHLVTLVQAVTNVYKRNNELKEAQNQILAKLDNLTKTLNSLIEDEASSTTTNKTSELQSIENKHNSVFYSIKTKVKNIFSLRFRTT